MLCSIDEYEKPNKIQDKKKTIQIILGWNQAEFCVFIRLETVLIPSCKELSILCHT